MSQMELALDPDDQALLDFLLEESGDLWTSPDEAVEAPPTWGLPLSEGPSDGEVEDLLSSLLSPPASSNVLSFSNPCPIHHDHTYSHRQEHDSTDLGGSEISEVRGEEWVHEPGSYLPFAGSGSYGKQGAQVTPLRVEEPLEQDAARLILTDEEKRVLEKDGFTLPGTLPLTKMEEQLLKRVRRKIRNKKSAQESRRKKKVYVGGLENRVLKCTARNLELQNKVQVLQEQNLFLLGQLRKLQAVVTEMSNRTSSSSTCVLVLLLSFSLLLLPAMYSSDTRGSLPAKHGVLSRQLRALLSEDALQLELPALQSEVPNDSKNQWLNSSGHVLNAPDNSSCLLYYTPQAPNAEPPLKWPFLDLFSGPPHANTILPLQANLTRKEGWFPIHNTSSVILQSRYSS